MRFWVTLTVLSLAIGTGCGGGSNESETLGNQISDTAGDTQLMKEAQSAANRITRNMADCEAVKADIDEVWSKLDEVEAKLRTAAGRSTIQTLRKQVKNVTDTCGIVR
jgi:hypothetical protein